MTWPEHAESIYQAIEEFNSNERAAEFLEDEDWDLLDEHIFEPVIDHFCELYGHEILEVPESYTGSADEICVKCGALF